MSITQFFSIVKESNYNIPLIFEKAFNESMIVLVLLVILLAIIVYFVRRKIKIVLALKLIEKIQISKSYEDFYQKISLLVNELPKRTDLVSDELNKNKEHILIKASKFLVNISIKEKIQKYQELSQVFNELTLGSQKYNNTELSTFCENTSKDLLEKNLYQEILLYIKTCEFNTNELDNINSIVAYANRSNNTLFIINPLLEEMDKLSFGYNLDFYKLVESFDKTNSKQVYKYCIKKIEELFKNAEDEVSVNILDYLMEKNEKEKVYSYISSLKIKTYLQQLYYIYFDKKNDIDLDLSFIANPLEIDSSYKDYIDNSLTRNWKDEEHIKFIASSKGVIDVLGHTEFRNIIQRIDTMEKERENRLIVEEALKVAKRAETIALEAKAINKRPN